MGPVRTGSLLTRSFPKGPAHLSAAVRIPPIQKIIYRATWLIG